MKTVRISEIISYLTCRKQHRYQYRMNVPQKPQPQMAFGTVVHSGFEHAIRAHVAGTDWETALAIGCALASEKIMKEAASLSEERQAEIEEKLIEAPLVALRAFKHLNPERWETLVINGMPAIEIPLVVKLADGINFSCTQDWIARDSETGQIWAFEFKTRKNLTPVHLGEVSLQQAAYQHVLALHGYKIEGAMEYAVRAALPKEPKLNKNGTMSRSALATDWPTYEAALIRAKLNPEDYADVKLELEAKEWFRFVPQYRTLDECKRTWNSVVVPIAREITYETAQPVPILARHVCSRCSYLDICMEELRGYASNFELVEDDDE